MASQLDHTPLPLVSLTTTIQQQKAHASISNVFEANQFAQPSQNQYYANRRIHLTRTNSD
jgi:hypothetical protein